jgi:hypothetical protein
VSDAEVQRRGLAARWRGEWLEHAGVPRQHIERVVCRSVGDDDDLAAIGRVVERPQVSMAEGARLFRAAMTMEMRGGTAAGSADVRMARDEASPDDGRAM